MNVMVGDNAATGAFGLSVTKLRGTNITASGNFGDGIQCKRAKVTCLVVTGNEGVRVQESSLGPKGWVGGDKWYASPSTWPRVPTRALLSSKRQVSFPIIPYIAGGN